MAQMLSIKVQNFRSFYHEQELRFGEDKARSVTALFGANSSGKSNTAKAIELLRFLITNSANANFKLPYEPFLLKDGSDQDVSSFEIKFTAGSRLFTYKAAFNAERIAAEVLKEKSASVNKMRVIFSRDAEGNMNPSANKFGFGNTLLKKTRKETLLITKAREDNNEYSNCVFELLNSFNVIPGDSHGLYGYAIELMRRNTGIKSKTLQLLRKCDFAIRDIDMKEVQVPEDMVANLPFSDEMKQDILSTPGTSIYMAHAIRDDERSVIGVRQFELMGQESKGTQKFFEIAAPIVDALEYGKTLYLDEFGAFLHPSLAIAIVNLFKSEKENQHGAVLILNSHNTAIMSQTGLKRDEIIIIEKNLSEESIITPLSEKAIREEAFEKRYREGLYGGIPMVGEM